MAGNKIVKNNSSPKPPSAGRGRPKGAPNKVTKTLREAIEASFDNVGGVDYLSRMAEEEPKAYLALLGKILPAHMSIKAETGPIELVIKRANANKAGTD